MLLWVSWVSEFQTFYIILSKLRKCVTLFSYGTVSITVERVRNSGTQFFKYLVVTLVAGVHHKKMCTLYDCF